MRTTESRKTRRMSEADLAELKSKAFQVLCQMRKTVLNRYPFVGSIAMYLDLVPTRDIDNPTACTDGKNMYFDIDFISHLNPEERAFVLAHEVMHNVMVHTIRKGNRDHMLFNIAADMEVNNMLAADGFTVPKNAVTSNKYYFNKGLSAEEYYDLLIQRQNDKYQVMPNKNGAPQTGSAEDSKCAPSGDGNDDGSLNGQFDKHVYEGEEKRDSKAKPDQFDKYGKVEKDADFSPQPKRDAAERIREAAVSVVQKFEREGRGEVPANWKRLINELLEPEISWKDQIAAQITCALGSKSNWSRPNRRFVSSGVYLSSHQSEKIRIAVGLDTSGSTADSIKKFLSEVNGIVKSFNDYELTVIQCDAAVQSVDTYDADHPLELESTEFKIHGGGGTCMKPIFDEIRKREIEIDSAIIFTDGDIETQCVEDAPDYEVTWVIDNKRLDEEDLERIGFGRTLFFK